MNDINQIPSELRPALNRMAFEIAASRGWNYPSENDFANSKNPRAIEMYRLAIVALKALDDYCMDGYGIGLTDLAALMREEDKDVEVEAGDIVIL